MASGPHTFMTGVVFSPEKYQGNRLAIVAVHGNTLTDERKSLIAKEFGYSETAFLHDAPEPGQPRRLDIFTERGEEVPFAGHPIIGVASYIFMFIDRLPYSGPAGRDTQRQSAVLMTKGGPVPIFYNPYRQVAACSVPHKFRVHEAKVHFSEVLIVQPQVNIVPTIDRIKDESFPIASIVNGMTFCLIDLTDAPDVLTALRVGNAPAMELDQGWTPSFGGAIYYVKQGEDKSSEPTIHKLRVRMITQEVEDPGTGSGCCALACYLALAASEVDSTRQIKTEEGAETASEDLAAKTKKISLGGMTEHHVFAIEQGVEMGRKCTIAVEVDVAEDADGKRSITGVILSGRCTFFARGEIFGTY